MKTQRPPIRVELMLREMETLSASGEPIPFNITYVKKDGEVVVFKEAILAKKLKSIPKQLKKSTGSHSSDGSYAVAMENSIKRLYIHEYNENPFRNVWFRSIIEYNGREVIH
jgi:hypothetical protein